MNTVVKAFYIDPHHAIEIAFSSIFGIADVGDTCVIHENINLIALEYLREYGCHFGLISNITGVRRCSSSRGGDFGRDGFGVLCTDIKNVYCGTIARELMRDGPANPAASTGDDCSFPIKPEFTRASVLGCQRETPRFQGIKSS
jgi:hypothetical protein